MRGIAECIVTNCEAVCLHKILRRMLDRVADHQFPPSRAMALSAFRRFITAKPAVTSSWVTRLSNADQHRLGNARQLENRFT